MSACHWRMSAVRRRRKSVGRVPVYLRGGQEVPLVTGRHALLHRGSERNTRVRHAERLRDAASNQVLIIRSGAARENVAEDSRTQIRIFDFGARVAWQRVAGEELVQIVHAVEDEKIGGVLYLPFREIQLLVAGEEWKAGAVRGKIE